MFTTSVRHDLPVAESYAENWAAVPWSPSRRSLECPSQPVSSWNRGKQYVKHFTIWYQIWRVFTLKPKEKGIKFFLQINY